ncbi:MAG: poly-gamma-glutamate biosynthesis protein PgsC [Myxococcales bacterium]|nr:poly-gamma-glutamate biosynthesis protein PgsC [Myxococcales bacterium]
MVDLSTISVGIGLVFSFVFSELFSLVPGGMVVPGYMALGLHEPIRVLVTLGVAVTTWLVVASLAQHVIIYGRRRTVLMILVGFLFNLLFERYLMIYLTSQPMELVVIGQIIPGLIAIWFDKQGPIVTTATLIIAAVSVRLVLILLYGSELML